MPLDDVGAFYVTQRPILTKNYREGTQSATRLRNAHDVRFGSKADMCSAQADVRFVPRADITELGFHQRLDFTSLIVVFVAPLPFH
ncbi:MAG: hypothetical protein WBL43_09665, partial [Pseudolabrys sp.]